MEGAEWQRVNEFSKAEPAKTNASVDEHEIPNDVEEVEFFKELSNLDCSPYSPTDPVDGGQSDQTQSQDSGLDASAPGSAKCPLDLSFQSESITGAASSKSNESRSEQNIKFEDNPYFIIDEEFGHCHTGNENIEVDSEEIDSETEAALRRLSSVLPNARCNTTHKSPISKEAVLEETANFISVIQEQIKQALTGNWNHPIITHSPLEHDPETADPKRPKNGFIRFSIKFRKDIAMEHPNLDNREISRILGSKWRKLSDKEKKPFEEEFIEEMAERRRENPDWKYGGVRKKLKADLIEPMPSRLRPRAKLKRKLPKLTRSYKRRKTHSHHYQAGHNALHQRYPILVFHSNWVQCDLCNKWRKLPPGVNTSELPEKWFCSRNPDVMHNCCEVEEEGETTSVGSTVHLQAVAADNHSRDHPHETDDHDVHVPAIEPNLPNIDQLDIHSDTSSASESRNYMSVNEFPSNENAEVILEPYDTSPIKGETVLTCNTPLIKSGKTGFARSPLSGTHLSDITSLATNQPDFKRNLLIDTSPSSETQTHHLNTSPLSSNGSSFSDFSVSLEHLDVIRDGMVVLGEEDGGQFDLQDFTQDVLEDTLNGADEAVSSSSCLAPNENEI